MRVMHRRGGADDEDRSDRGDPNVPRVEGERTSSRPAFGAQDQRVRPLTAQEGQKSTHRRPSGEERPAGPAERTHRRFESKGSRSWRSDLSEDENQPDLCFEG